MWLNQVILLWYAPRGNGRGGNQINCVCGLVTLLVTTILTNMIYSNYDYLIIRYNIQLNIYWINIIVRYYITIETLLIIIIEI